MLLRLAAESRVVLNESRLTRKRAEQPEMFALHFEMRNGTATDFAESTNYRKFGADRTIQFDGDRKQ